MNDNQGHPPERKPKETVRGWWFPIEIVRLVQDGTINATEMVLLGQIDSLVSEDQGCFAGNEYLGKKIGKTAKAVSDMVSKLRRLGLVEQIGFDGRKRYLITCWSRIKIQKPEKQASVESGKSLRAPRKRHPENTDYKNTVTTTREQRTSVEDSNESYYSSGQGPVNGNSTETLKEPDVGFVKEFDKKKSRIKRETGPWSPEAGNAARRIRKLWHAHNGALRLPKEGTVAKEIEKIFRHAVPKEEVEKAIQWAEKHYGNTFCHRVKSIKGLPAAIKSWSEMQKRERESGREHRNLSTEELLELFSDD